MGKKAKKAKKEYRAALARVGSQLLTQAERFKYSESQPRDDHGRWSSDGSADSALAAEHHPVDRGGNTVCSCGFGDNPKFLPYHGGGSGGDQLREARSRDDFFHHLSGVASMQSHDPVARAQADVAARNARTPNPILAAMGQPTNKAAYKAALARNGSTLLTSRERAQAMKYSEDQPRDEQGRFTSGGGGDRYGGENPDVGAERARNARLDAYQQGPMGGVQHGEIVSHAGNHAMVTTASGLNAGKWGVHFYDKTTGHPFLASAHATKDEAMAAAHAALNNAASGSQEIGASHDRHQVNGEATRAGCPACYIPGDYKGD